MHQWTPYRNVEVNFDGRQTLQRAGILDARQVSGGLLGRYQAQSVREGMQSFTCDLRLTEPLHIAKVLPESLCLVQVLEGQWTHRIAGHEHHYHPGAPLVLGLHEATEAVDRLPADGRARMAGLRISGSLLRELDEHEHGSFTPLLALQRDPGRLHRLERCQALGSLLASLYHSPYGGGLGRLHRESLALGMLVELASHLRHSQALSALPSRAGRDLAHEARYLLDRQLDDPPSSQELARRLGIGQTTLRRLFKAEFGQTMLDYLRDRRLETARSLLRDGRLQVAQVAWRVGYRCPTNFAHAYKARFGLSPRQESGSR
jgi:AraC-like DNA-binding protein